MGARSRRLTATVLAATVLAGALSACSEKEVETTPAPAPSAQHVAPSLGETAAPSASPPSPASSSASAPTTGSQRVYPSAESADEANAKHPEYRQILERAQRALTTMTEFDPRHESAEQVAIRRAADAGYFSKQLTTNTPAPGPLQKPGDPTLWNWAANREYITFPQAYVPEASEWLTWNKAEYGMDHFPLLMHVTYTWGPADSGGKFNDRTETREYYLQMIKQKGQWVIDSYSYNVVATDVPEDD